LEKRKAGDHRFSTREAGANPKREQHIGKRLVATKTRNQTGQETECPTKVVKEP